MFPLTLFVSPSVLRRWQRIKPIKLGVLVDYCGPTIELTMFLDESWADIGVEEVPHFVQCPDGERIDGVGHEEIAFMHSPYYEPKLKEFGREILKQISFGDVKIKAQVPSSFPKGPDQPSIYRTHIFRSQNLHGLTNNDDPNSLWSPKVNFKDPIDIAKIEDHGVY